MAWLAVKWELGRLSSFAKLLTVEVFANKLKKPRYFERDASSKPFDRAALAAIMRAIKQAMAKSWSTRNAAQSRIPFTTGFFNDYLQPLNLLGYNWTAMNFRFMIGLQLNSAFKANFEKTLKTNVYTWLKALLIFRIVSSKHLPKP